MFYQGLGVLQNNYVYILNLTFFSGLVSAKV